MESREPMKILPREPWVVAWEKGPTDRLAFAWRQERHPGNHQSSQGRFWKAEFHMRFAGGYRGTVRCQLGHVLLGKWKFPQKGNFSLDGKGAT